MNIRTVNTVASPSEASTGIVDGNGQLLPWSGETVNRRRMLSATAATGAALVAPAFLTPAHAEDYAVSEAVSDDDTDNLVLTSANPAYKRSPSTYFNHLRLRNYRKVYYDNYLKSGRKSWVAYAKDPTKPSWWCTDNPTLYKIENLDGDIWSYSCNGFSGKVDKIAYYLEGTGRRLPAAIIPDKLKAGMPSKFITNWSQSLIATYLGWMEFTKTGDPTKDLWTRMWAWDYTTKAWRVLTYQTRKDGVDIRTNMSTIKDFMQTSQLCVKDFNSLVSKGLGLSLGFAMAQAIVEAAQGLEIGSIFPIVGAVIVGGITTYALLESLSSYNRNLYYQVSQKDYEVVKR